MSCIEYILCVFWNWHKDGVATRCSFQSSSLLCLPIRSFNNAYVTRVTGTPLTCKASYTCTKSLLIFLAILHLEVVRIIKFLNENLTKQIAHIDIYMLSTIKRLAVPSWQICRFNRFLGPQFAVLKQLWRWPILALTLVNSKTFASFVSKHFGSLITGQ